MEPNINKIFMIILYFLFCFWSVSATVNSSEIISPETSLNESVNETSNSVDYRSKINSILSQLNDIDEKIYKNERKLDFISSLRNDKSRAKADLAGTRRERRRQSKQQQQEPRHEPSPSKEMTNSSNNTAEIDSRVEDEDAYENSEGSAIKDEREYQFMNKLLKKIEYRFSEEVVDFGFLGTKSYNQNAGTFLLLVLLKNYSVVVLDNMGQKIKNYDIGHPANRIHVSPFMDEYVFLTYGFDDIVKVHLVNFDKELEGKQAKYSVEIADAFINLKQQSEIQIEAGTSVTGLVSHMLRGLKYIFISDNSGKIQIFHKNGTHKSSIIATENNSSIINMVRQYSAVVFATNNNFGFINFQTMKAHQLKCPKIDSEIMDIAFDSQNSQIVYVLLRSLDIHALEIKASQEGACKFVHKFDASRQINKLDKNNDFKLISTRIYLMLLDISNNKFLVFNTTELLSDEFKAETPFNSIILQKTLPGDSKISYTVHKNSIQSTFVACVEKNLERSELHVFEMLTPSKPVTDILSYIRIPVIVMAILGVFGYQYWQRKKPNPKGRATEMTKAEKFAKKHMDDLSEERLNSSKYGGRNDFKPDEKKKIEKYQESLDFLNKKTKELASSLDKLKSSGGPAGKIRELEETLDSLRKLE